MTTDKNPGGEMTPEAFEALVETYGAEPSRWPESARAHALALLESSHEAQILAQGARALDGLLDKAPAGEVHSALSARILAAAPGASVGADHKSSAGERMSRLGGLVTLAWPQSGWARSGWVSPAVVLTASLAAGFFVGSSASGPYETYEESDLFAYVFEMPTTWDTGANTWDTGEQQ